MLDCFKKKIKIKKPVKEHDKNPPWLNEAIGELNTVEISGNKHNPRIIEYHQTTSLKAKDDETSWCSSFVNWCFKQVGIEGTNSAAARSWLNWGRVLEEPKRGCVVIFWRVSIKSWQAHVAFYIGETKDHILCLGGNQNNTVNISKYPKKRLLGYRWPNSVKNS